MADTDKSLYNLRYNQLSSCLEAFGGGSPQWTLITLNNVDPQQVPITRLINTTTPLQGGGNLTVDRTLSILQSSNISDGYLSSVDWNTFNNKQVAGNYITALTGDATATGPGSVALTLATVNGNVGTFSYASITVNAKGLITSASSAVPGSLTDVGTDGIVVTGGTGAVIGAGTSLAQHVADTTHNGYLSSTDWNTFNGKQSTTLTNTHILVGNVSNVATDVALSGDATLANTGAMTLATVNANTGSFGSSTAIPSFTVNGKGLITAASTNVVIAPAGTLTGTTLAANVVTSSLTSVGTITSGTWTGTAIAVANGGTGQTTYTNGQILIGNTTGNTLTKTTLTGTTNQITVTNGTGSITLSTPQDIATGSSPTFSSLTLTNPLTVANGGSGVASHTAYAVICGGTTSTGAVQSIASVGTTGQVLTSNGAGALPTFQANTVGYQNQVLASTFTTFNTSSASYQTSNLSASITPTSSSHRIKITATFAVSTGGAGQPQVSLFRGSTNLDTNGNGFFQATGLVNPYELPVTISWIDSPATTSATTYAIKLLSTNGATTVHMGDGLMQNMILEEIS